MGPEGDNHALPLYLAGAPYDHAYEFLVPKVDAVKVPEGYDAVGEPGCDLA
jgi:hypothetical protein